jgi:hypothetical protein
MIKSLYGGLSQKQLYLYSKKTTSGIPASNGVISKLESRLDVLVFRLYFATSLSESREIIKKGFIQVNSQIILSPTFSVKVGSIIKSTNLSSLKSRFRFFNFPLPSYLYLSSPLSGILLSYPVYDSSQAPFKYFQRYTRSLLS